MLSVILIRFDKIDSLHIMRKDEDSLLQEQTDLQKIHASLENFYANVDGVTACWTCRTRPRLEIMKQVMRKVIETRWATKAACKAYFKAMIDGLQEIEHNIGGIDYYLGKDQALSKDALALVRAQLDRVANLIRLNDAKDVLKKAKHVMVVPNLIGVRVVACHGLPTGTVFSNYNPFVRMRVKKEGDWVKTGCRDSQSSPRWHSGEHPVEFRFMVEGFGKELTCQVMDEHFGFEDTFMGELRTEIDSLKKGKWTKISKELEDPVDEHNPGKLHVEVFLVREAADLFELMPAAGQDNFAEEGLAKDRFAEQGLAQTAVLKNYDDDSRV
jgi:hypothetical protein